MNDKSRVLLLIEQHPDLMALGEERSQRRKVWNDRLAFIEKQKEAVEREGEEYHTVFWKQVEAYLELKGLLPEDFNKEDDSLRFDLDFGGIVFTKDGYKDQRSFVSRLTDWLK